MSAEHQKKLRLQLQIPLYLLTIGLVVLFFHVGRPILIPLILSLLAAILLRPLSAFMQRKLRFPAVLAILVSVILFVALVSSISFFTWMQISDISDDWETIQENLSCHYETFQIWINNRFGIDADQLQHYINRIKSNLLDGNGAEMGKTISSFSSSALQILLVPIFTFLILLYREILVNFLYKIVRDNRSDTLTDILAHIKSVIQSYLIGLSIEIVVVATMMSIGLALLGVEYAIFLGIITALLNLIPYIGIFVATLITLFASLINSSDPSIMISVLILCAVVQFIDNNIMVPKIVGEKVRINVLTSIVGVIVGGMIAGIAGMFLAIPIMAILKVIFDRIEVFAPWGYLMGYDKFRKTRMLQVTKPDLSEKKSDGEDKGG